MKDKFVTYDERPLNGMSACSICARKNTNTKDCMFVNKCGGCYYVKVRKPRPSKYERLLKALLKCENVWRCICHTDFEDVTESQWKELQKIKEAMK